MPRSSAKCALTSCTRTSPAWAQLMPDAKTMGRWGVAVGPSVLKRIHEQMVRIARDKGITTGRRMRVDTTVVETNIHHPTDSTLLGDGVRVLTRIMKKITAIAGATGTRLRDRSRSVKLRVLEIARVARAKGPINQEKLKQRYHQLLETTSRVVGQAKRFSNEVAEGVKRSADMLQQLALDRLGQQLDTMLPLVRHVMRQTRERIFRGKTRTQGKILSLFEPATEVIRKGKLGKPNQFGNMVKLQEAENQIVIDYEVYNRRPSDTDLLRSTPGQAGTSTALGRGGRRLLFRQERRGGKGDGRQARVHSQSLQQKPRAQTRAEEALVPQWAKMADRMRGAHQRGQAATRSRSLPLQRLRRNEPLGWSRHHRRQRRQHRPRDRKTIKAIGSPSPLPPAGRSGRHCLTAFN